MTKILDKEKLHREQPETTSNWGWKSWKYDLSINGDEVCWNGKFMVLSGVPIRNLCGKEIHRGHTIQSTSKRLGPKMQIDILSASR